MQAVVFVRPTRENITLLKREVKAPRFQHMYICECAENKSTQRALGSNAHS
jgi:predicted SprT family Zn-dependent metalloprotease